jgi:regulator of sigma E protease
MGEMTLLIALFVVIGAHVVVHGAARFVAARILGVRNWLVRRLVTLTGPIANYGLAVVLVCGGYLIAGRQYRDEASMEVDVAPGGPAAQAGMRTGDRILSIGDEQPENWEAMKRILASHAGEPVDLTIERADQEMHVTVTPAALGTADEGTIKVAPPFKSERIGVLRSVKMGLLEPIKAPARALLALGRRLRGSDTPQTLFGPAGIFRVERRGPSIGDILKLLGTLSGFLLPIFGIVVLVPPSRSG